jgi:hypothetical protein
MFSYKNSLALLAFFYMCYCWWIHESDHPRGFNHVEYAETMEKIDEVYEKGMDSMSKIHIPVYGYRPDESGRLETYEINKKPEPKVTSTPTPKPKPKIVAAKPQPTPPIISKTIITPPEPEPVTIAVAEVDPEIPVSTDNGMEDLIDADREFLKNNDK